MADSPSDESRRPRPRSGGAPKAPRRAGDGGPFRVLKPGQGAHVRWGSAAGAMIVAIGFAFFLHGQLGWFPGWVQQLTPPAVLALLAYGIFWLIGQQRGTVDFMIATESEMKKVNWSSRREVWGATKVVIATVLALGALLFLVNLVFIFMFESIGVLRVGMLSSLLGGGGDGE